MENPRHGDGEGSVDHFGDHRFSSMRHNHEQQAARALAARRAVMGPEISGRGWSVISASVQVIERAKGGPRRFAVVALHPGRRIDVRYPIRYFAELRQARSAALELARQIGHAAPDWPPSRLGPSIDGVQCGPVLCLEALA